MSHRVKRTRLALGTLLLGAALLAPGLAAAAPRTGATPGPARLAASRNGPSSAGSRSFSATCGTAGRLPAGRRGSAASTRTRAAGSIPTAPTARRVP